MSKQSRHGAAAFDFAERGHRALDAADIAWLEQIADEGRRPLPNDEWYEEGWTRDSAIARRDPSYSSVSGRRLERAKVRKSRPTRTELQAPSGSIHRQSGVWASSQIMRRGL